MQLILCMTVGILLAFLDCSYIYAYDCVRGYWPKFFYICIKKNELSKFCTGESL